MRVAIFGLPNMGKSTLINALKVSIALSKLHQDQPMRRGARITPRDAKSNSIPGTTKQIGSFMVNTKPKITVLDSPGITLSKDNEDPERSVKLAALGCFPDHI